MDIAKIIVEAIVSIAVTVIVRYLIPYIKNKIGNDNYNDLVAFIEITVRAAKQTLDSNGEKKEYVLKQVNEWLAALKIEMTAEQIDALIEGIYNKVKVEDSKG